MLAAREYHVRFHGKILTVHLNSIAMEPRAPGVSSTLAPWSMNEAEEFMIENCQKRGSRGIGPFGCLPLSWERGGHLHKFH